MINFKSVSNCLLHSMTHENAGGLQIQNKKVFLIITVTCIGNHASKFFAR